VSNVRVGGERKYAMKVWLNRQAMAARGITSSDIENTLRTENVELPAGEIEYAILSVAICNRSDTAVNNVNIAVASGDVPSNSEFIEWYTTIVPRGVLERTQIIAAVGDRIIVRVGTP